jgi:hypothetical protein
MYISCDISLLPNPLLNAQQHQHTRTCNHVVYKFHYPFCLLVFGAIVVKMDNFHLFEEILNFLFFIRFANYNNIKILKIG